MAIFFVSYTKKSSTMSMRSGLLWYLVVWRSWFNGRDAGDLGDLWVGAGGHLGKHGLIRIGLDELGGIGSKGGLVKDLDF
ncbi:Hypothetical predicted protein [Olea europaea subsp. europaea]|uniref:Uncharacterized protein n=1 Tax=Olea europaea subsp. europaea TaxID=158383 RepID=A0A8S0R6H9_OLEEU|nr:Hypothetical predicted protein [Olea europaea subsp. europaea]